MRVVVVGTPAERQRLRTRIDRSVEIVAEFDTLAEARRAAAGADAILLTPAGRPDTRDEEEIPSEALTMREKEVLQLLAEGLPNKAIAARLGISDQTVKFHVASIAAKLGATNRTDAVRLAVRRGLIAL